jgi:hypothetical protein
MTLIPKKPRQKYLSPFNTSGNPGLRRHLLIHASTPNTALLRSFFAVRSRIPTDMSAASAAVLDDAKLLMHEIYAALVIASTLGEEIRALEDERIVHVHTSPQAERAAVRVANEAAELLKAAAADAEAMEQTAADALQAALRERTLRMRQASKLRVLQTENTSVPALLAELDAERKRGHQRERALREAQVKAQQAAERQVAASHGLKSERQAALRQARALGARRMASLVRQDAARAMAHSFTSWAAKASVGLNSFHPESLVPVAHVLPRTRAALADGHEQLRRALDGSLAEGRRLRVHVAQLEAALVVQHSQQMALQRAAERAAEASHALLAERRACAALRAETAELRAVMAGRLVVEEGGGGGGGEHLLDGRLVRVGS